MNAELVRALKSRIFRQGVARNAMALGYGQASRMVVQLLSVPVFTYFWGLGEYGTWLLLFTVPSFIAMGDLGFNIAASNAIIHSIEKGDRRGAADIFGAVRRGVLAFSATVLGVSALVLFARPELVDWVAIKGSPAVPTVLAVIAYGLVGLQAATTTAGFRSTGAYAEGNLIFDTSGIVETIAALSVVALGGNMLDVALTYLGFRIMGGALAVSLLRRRAPVLFARRERPAFAVLRDLGSSAMAVMALPIANAVSLQGSVALIGLFGGPALVPVFTATRTLSRLSVQLSIIVPQAAMPQVTAAVARGDKQQVDRLVGGSLAIGALVLTTIILVLAVLGHWLLGLWTHGQIQPGNTMLGLMLAAAFVYAIWMAVANFLLAASRQASYSYFFLTASVIYLPLTGFLVGRLGIEGAAIATLVLDVVMLVWVVRKARRAGLLGPETMRHVLRSHPVASLRALLTRKLRA